MRAARAFRLTACTAAIIVIAGIEARAGFTYSSSSSTPVVTTGSLGTSSIALGTVTSATTLTTPTLAALLKVGDSTSTSPDGPTDSFTISFTDTITITNVPPPGGTLSGQLTFSGTLTFTRSDTGGEVSRFTLTSISGPTLIDGMTYLLSEVSYTAPTVNSANGSGNISGLITSVGPSVGVIPEPASLSMLGLGLVGIAGFSVKRREVSTT